jgi:putative phosphoribosyl transferase
MTSRPKVFEDRARAGAELASELRGRSLAPPLLVLGLPRGGVPVASAVARALDAPLDVLVVRKIGMPGQPELAIGAIASGGIVVHEPRVGALASGPRSEFELLVQQQRQELERREHAYRHGLPPLEMKDRTVILVDDGIATGATMLAAVRSARMAGARAVVVAAPVASPQAVAMLGREADDVVVLQAPPLLMSIGEWYVRFDQLEDAEVLRLLGRRAHARTAPVP